jgi:SRSO17 transposase
VFLAYASRHGRALIDRVLYLPESWAGDAGRREEAGVPTEVVFATKPKLGRAMLERAFAAGVPCIWVTGDSVYGADHSLRRAVEKSGRGYVLAVTSGQHLGLKPVADWLEDVPGRAWKRLSAGDGAKGPRLYDWVWLPYRSDTARGWKRGLLIRRQIAKPDEFTFYLTLSPEGSTLADLVRVAGTRWTIEACFEAAKGETGLDQYEVRSWTGWHRHVTFAMLAHAYLAVLRRAAIGGRGEPRPRGRTPAPHRAGSAPAAVAPDVGARARPRAGPGLVPLATATPAAGAALPLATADRSR